MVSLVVLGPLLWSFAPTSWHEYMDAGDGSIPLMILFVALPAALGLLAAFGFVCGALALTPFVSREDAEQFLLALPFGGHIGRWETMLLSRFNSRGAKDT